MHEDAPSSPESAYLDAARDCIVAVGWRRTTLTDIARRAGVSRMTIYRRWPDTRTLLADLLVREWSELLLESGFAGEADDSARSRIARGIGSMSTALRENALFQRIVEVDPELLHPYLFGRRGRNQNWMLELLEHSVESGQAEGSVRPGRPSTLARALLLAAYGFVLSADTMADGAVDTVELDAELVGLVNRYLAP
jgi:AcrR family transcriptional regulator